VNREPQNLGILRQALAAFQRTTGLRAAIQAERSGAKDNGVDAFVKIPNSARGKRFAAVIKAADRFQTPAQVKAKFNKRATQALLVAPYVSRQVGEHCRDLQLGFIDTAGNAYVKTPGVYVYVNGQPRPAEINSARFPATRVAGLQITFALLARPELVRAPYRELATAAAVALGAVTPVMRDLEARGLLSGSPIRRLLDPRRLVEEFATHYPIALRPKLHPRRFEGRPEELDRAALKPLEAYWGGEPAAERLTDFLRRGTFTIYTRKAPGRLVAALRLRASISGNVEVLDAFWNFEPDPKRADVAPAVLVYADLLATRDGRNVEAADMIYERHIEPAFQTRQAAR